MLPLMTALASGLLGTLGAAVILAGGTLLGIKVTRASSKEVNRNLDFDQVQEDRDAARKDAKEARVDARQARLDAKASREASEKAYAAIEQFRIEIAAQSRYIAYLLRHMAEHKITAPLSQEAFLANESKFAV